MIWLQSILPPMTNGLALSMGPVRWFFTATLTPSTHVSTEVALCTHLTMCHTPSFNAIGDGTLTYAPLAPRKTQRVNPLGFSTLIWPPAVVACPFCMMLP